MIKIASVPYEKVYKFSYFSDAICMKWIVYALALVLPFFIVFSVNSKCILIVDFYLSFSDSVYSAPSITFSYNYHLTITTSASVYSYTTLYQQNPSKPISFSHETNSNQLTQTWTINWIKPIDERVTAVSLAVFVGYQLGSITGEGIVVGQAQGYDIA